MRWLVGIMLMLLLAGCGGDTATSSSGGPSGSSRPTPTPAQSNDDVEQKYQRAIERISGEISDSLDDFRALASDARIADPEWRADVAVALATWKSAHVAVSRLVPPDGYDAFHDRYVQSTESLDAAADDAARGIDTMDGELIASATRHLDEVTRLANEANAIKPWD